MPRRCNDHQQFFLDKSFVDGPKKYDCDSVIVKIDVYDDDMPAYSLYMSEADIIELVWTAQFAFPNLFPDTTEPTPDPLLEAIQPSPPQ